MLKNFKNWIESVLNEESNSTFKYGCAMVYYDFPQMLELHSSIDPGDVYAEEGDRTYGLEDEPHTTLLYGFHHDVDPNEVLRICSGHKYPQLTLKNSSIFDNPKYDVLKFDVDSPVLHQVNSQLAKLPHTTDFPDYHPHSTVGYLKKGKGQHYASLFNDREFKVTPKKIVYSMPTGEKREIQL